MLFYLRWMGESLINLDGDKQEAGTSSVSPVSSALTRLICVRVWEQQQFFPHGRTDAHQMPLRSTKLSVESNRSKTLRAENDSVCQGPKHVQRNNIRLRLQRRRFCLRPSGDRNDCDASGEHCLSVTEGSKKELYVYMTCETRGDYTAGDFHPPSSPP